MVERGLFFEMEGGMQYGNIGVGLMRFSCKDEGCRMGTWRVSGWERVFVASRFEWHWMMTTSRATRGSRMLVWYLDAGHLARVYVPHPSNGRE